MPKDGQCDKCGECCYKVYVKLLTTGGTPLTSIAAGESFKVAVEVQQAKASSTVLSSTADTLTLNDASEFAGSGTGYLKASYKKFSWTGKSGNQLTGVSGHGDPVAKGTTVKNISGLADRSFTATVIATVSGDEDDPQPTKITLSQKTITITNGTGETTMQVPSNPYYNNKALTISVRSEELGSDGPCGDAVCYLNMCSAGTPGLKVTVTGIDAGNRDGTDEYGDYVNRFGNKWYNGEAKILCPATYQCTGSKTQTSLYSRWTTPTPFGRIGYSLKLATTTCKEYWAGAFNFFDGYQYHYWYSRQLYAPSTWVIIQRGKSTQYRHSTHFNDELSHTGSYLNTIWQYTRWFPTPTWTTGGNTQVTTTSQMNTWNPGGGANAGCPAKAGSAGVCTTTEGITYSWVPVGSWGGCS